MLFNEDLDLAIEGAGKGKRFKAQCRRALCFITSQDDRVMPPLEKGNTEGWPCQRKQGMLTGQPEKNFFEAILISISFTTPILSSHDNPIFIHPVVWPYKYVYQLPLLSWSSCSITVYRLAPISFKEPTTVSFFTKKHRR